ncbi:MAG TPA: SpoIIE family protein phosphatase [Pyrinomonadaceae bacterium]|nr:SpoIIE family protein phosphatase [Pyrinomonadaceae bacterium]
MRGEGGGRWALVAERLRRVMPRVALVAVVLAVVRWLVADTAAYNTTPLGLLGPLTAVVVTAAVVYYGARLLLRLKRMLLWRVRRRLVITYLFVGLTPVVLLLVLGFVAAVGGSSQAMVRVVTVQFKAAERQALDEARALAEGLLELPSGAGEAAEREWLEARAVVLRAALPGARVAGWREVNGTGPWRTGSGERARLRSVLLNDETRGVGFDAGEAGGPLPEWLDGQPEWGGLAYLPPPEDTGSAHGTPFIAGLARRTNGARSVAVLVTVPVSRALVGRVREDTGVDLRPFFIGTKMEEERGGRAEEAGDASLSVNEEGETSGRIVVNQGGRRREVDFSRDQFGERMPNVSPTNFWSPVFLNSTDWTTGTREARWAFIVDWSWSTGVARLWDGEVMGQFWWRLLYTVGIIFLLLELLALLSAAWMTRAVTGTVHKLYRATELIKRGDFSHRIRTDSHDQLGELAHAFNDMSADIEQLLAERVEHERLEREIEIAAEVQAQLFPRGVPALRTAEMSGECRAARGVAGDYYDFIEVAPGAVVFTLGDVSGKGISAALVMSNLQAVLRAQATILSERLKLAGLVAAAATQGGAGAVAVAEPGPELPCGVTGVDRECAVEQMTASINGQLCRSTDTNRFATLFLALYDDRARSLRYTNAGHNAPVVVRAGGQVERLEAGGTVVGAFDFVSYVEARTTLGPGDLVVLFSDGISEAQNDAGEEFGEERIVEFAAARRHLSADSLREALFDEVDRWTGDAERYDDQTLVILKGAPGEADLG